MPWRNYIDSEFHTYETTDMSDDAHAARLAEGWRQANHLELQLAQLCRPYGVAKVRETLDKITAKSYFDSDQPSP